MYHELCTQYPDEFHDWKVTLLFYTALHWVRALAKKRRIKIGESHAEIARNCNPQYPGAMPISCKAWDEYHNLNMRSQTARYEGIVNEKGFNNFHKDMHSRSISGIDYLRKYIQGRGIEL